jgi:DNA-binding response OmpR family regulator
LTALNSRAEKKPLLAAIGDNNNNNNSNNNILLLDDEPEIIEILKVGLEDNGFIVDAFTDPFLALEDFRNNSGNYSLVLSDVRMPGINGFEFASKVREMNPLVKILLMSAFEVSEFEFLNIKSTLKVDGFIRKPVSVEELIEKIQKVY